MAALLATLALVVGLAPPAQATWPHSPLTGVVVCPYSGDQNSLCRPISDGLGGMFVVWVDSRNGTGNRDIYAQRLDAQGVPQWTANGIRVCYAANDQASPVAIASNGGSLVIAWTDLRSGATSDIYVQKLNRNGTIQWTTNGVAVCTAANNQHSIALAPDSSGGVILGWMDYRFGESDIYAQRVSTAGIARWTANGVALCSTTGLQDWLDVVSDDAGGAIFSWRDQRGGDMQIYAQRVNGTGAAQWTAQGVRIASTTAAQLSPQIVTDGAGGGILTWYELRASDDDVFAQRVTASGTPLWGTGVQACSNTANQMNPVCAADGSGGVFIAWQDERSSDWDIYAQHLDGGGGLVWSASGAPVCALSSISAYLTDLVPDGAGGLILSWSDTRNTVHADSWVQRIGTSGSAQWTHNGVAVSRLPGYDGGAKLLADGAGGVLAAWTYSGGADDQTRAQHVDRFGMLGDAAPAIANVSDVPNDQGGQLQVEWTASYLDTFPDYGIAQYSVWRRIPNAAAQAASVALAPGTTARLGDGRVLYAGVEGAQAVYWQQIGTQVARGLPGYSFVAATTSDSMPGSNPYTSFMVMAEESGGLPYWASAADSGYSVDDLAPPTPAPFTGTYATGNCYLQWGASPAPDLAEYRLYRGTSADFSPGGGNLVVAQSAPGYVDAAGGPYFYKLCAVDLHGNASPYAFLQPSGTLDVPGSSLPRELALSRPAPNPSRGSTTLTLALPREAAVSLVILDLQGRRVRTLVGGALPAGEHAISWDGRDDAGRRVPNGVFLVRCGVEGRELTRRVVLLR